MSIRRLALSAFALTFAVIGPSRLWADEQKGSKASDHNCILDAMAAKLGLSAAQKEQMRKTHGEYEQKAESLEHQIWTLQHQECEASAQLLTAEQRTQVPHAIKAEIDRRLQQVAAKLDLNDEQRQRLEKVRAEYAPKFKELMGAKADKEKDSAASFHQLRKQEFEAICMELNNEQRTRLPGILKAEFRNWRSAAGKAEFLKDVENKLGMTAEQRQKCDKVRAEYEPRLETLHGQLRQVWKEKETAIRQLMDEKQRAEFDQLMKQGSEKARERQ